MSQDVELNQMHKKADYVDGTGFKKELNKQSKKILVGNQS